MKCIEKIISLDRLEFYENIQNLKKMIKIWKKYKKNSWFNKIFRNKWYFGKKFNFYEIKQNLWKKLILIKCM